MLGLRERKKAATRAALRRAALRLVAEHGFDAVTVEEIADVVGVAPRTFFRYFASKEEVIVDDRELAEELAALLEQTPIAQPPVAAVRTALVSLAGRLDAGDRAEILARQRLIATTPALLARSLEQHQAWEAVLETWLVAHRGTVDRLGNRLLAAVCVAAVRVAVEAWVASDGHDDVETHAASALDQISRGLDLQPPDQPGVYPAGRGG